MANKKKKPRIPKYEVIDSLPSHADTVKGYAEKNSELFKSAAYVHVKYDRYKFGYNSPATGERKTAPYPGYDIRTFKGVCFVIPFKKEQK